MTNLQNFQINFFLPFNVVLVKHSIRTRKLTSKMGSLDQPHWIVGTLLMDLSKAYDCVNHELIITKLATYGLNEDSLRLFKIIIKQKTAGKNSFSLGEWLEIIQVSP